MHGKTKLPIDSVPQGRLLLLLMASCWIVLHSHFCLADVPGESAPYPVVAAVNKAQPNLIAQQDIDAAKSKDRAATAALRAAIVQDNVAEADVKKLRVLEGYTKITAPFGGVITKRYSDPGALIQAGTSTGS